MVKAVKENAVGRGPGGFPHPFSLRTERCSASRSAELLENNKILYIDHDPDNSSLIKRVLEADGYLVLLAPNGLEGLTQACHERPNLILVDIHLRGPDGYEVARRLRQMDQTRNTPILAVSTSGNPEDKHLSIAVGCNDYIVKPIDVDRISKQIAAYLQLP